MTDGASFTDPTENIQNYDLPARKAILQYLVRMGSFTSAPKIENKDAGDKDVELPFSMSWEDLNAICKQKLSGLPDTVPRATVELGGSIGGQKIRVMQWNILAQALADGCDSFARCPKAALQWETRRWRILEEISGWQPDILMMQEVDHMKLLQRALAGMGYISIFSKKPDSPCLYIQNNNGPDGCAMFFNTRLFFIVSAKTRIIEIEECQTNQVAIFVKIRRRTDGAEMWVGTTHLKAMPGIFMASLRQEQGKDLVSYMKSINDDNTPMIFCGDLNATPDEPVHRVLAEAGLISCYDNRPPHYTTWSVREDGQEYLRTLDYMLVSRGDFHIERVRRMPYDEEIGHERVPSYKYPSDHIALIADLVPPCKRV